MNYHGWNAVEKKLQEQDEKLAHEYLSSSGDVYSGYKLDVNVGFLKAKPAVSSKVQALVVTRAVHCYRYTGSGPCPSAQITRSICNGNCRQMHMGVGFRQAKNGQSGFILKNNALLQVDSINEKQKPMDFRIGYIITSQNITLGITESNSASFKLVKLNQANTSQSFDWEEVAGSVAVTLRNRSTGPWIPANFLLDTGITESFLNLPITSGVSMNEDLPVNTTVNIRFGEINRTQIANDTDYSYSYTVGVAPNGPTDPFKRPYAYNHILTNTSKRAFVNTGFNFYKTHNILFDAEGGFWGVSTH